MGEAKSISVWGSRTDTLMIRKGGKVINHRASSLHEGYTYSNMGGQPLGGTSPITRRSFRNPANRGFRLSHRLTSSQILVRRSENKKNFGSHFVP